MRRAKRVEQDLTPIWPIAAISQNVYEKSPCFRVCRVPDE
jgi:hypothetical protein